MDKEQVHEVADQHPVIGSIDDHVVADVTVVVGDTALEVLKRTEEVERGLQVKIETANLILQKIGNGEQVLQPDVLGTWPELVSNLEKNPDSLFLVEEDDGTYSVCLALEQGSGFSSKLSFDELVPNEVDRNAFVAAEKYRHAKNRREQENMSNNPDEYKMPGM